MLIKSIDINGDTVEIAVSNGDQVVTFTYTGEVRTNLQSDNNGNNLWLTISTAPRATDEQLKARKHNELF